MLQQAVWCGTQEEEKLIRKLKPANKKFPPFHRGPLWRRFMSGKGQQRVWKGAEGSSSSLRPHSEQSVKTMAGQELGRRQKYYSGRQIINLFQFQFLLLFTVLSCKMSINDTKLTTNQPTWLTKSCEGTEIERDQIKGEERKSDAEAETAADTFHYDAWRGGGYAVWDSQCNGGRQGVHWENMEDIFCFTVKMQSNFQLNS